jgi:hypothetical protein
MHGIEGDEWSTLESTHQQEAEDYAYGYSPRHLFLLFNCLS